VAGPAEWNLITRQEVTEKTGKGLVNDLLRAQRQFVESLLLEFIMGFLGSSQHQQFPQLVMLCPRTSYFLSRINIELGCSKYDVDELGFKNQKNLFYIQINIISPL